MGEAENYILKVIDLNVEINKQPILNHISFKVQRGASLAIVGPNGAGKTMLFRSLLNLIPYSGKIEWAKGVRIGYVPQNVSVKDIPLSVKEFLSYRDHVSYEKALSDARLNPDVKDKPLSALSGGELRRVLVAWALLDKPTVLLFDEPTAGVDMGGEESIFLMLSELKKKMNITLLLITHDLHLVREYTDTLIGLNKCLTYYGDSQRIVDPELQHRIYGQTVCLGEVS
jgi:zinc transport system ATP-binding protein